MWQNRSTLFSLDTAKDSAAPAPLPREGQEQPEQVPEADPRRRRAQAAPVEQEGVEPPLAQLRRALQRPATRTSTSELDPTAKEYFEKTLAFMNEQGADAAHRAHARSTPSCARSSTRSGWTRAPRAGRRRTSSRCRASTTSCSSTSPTPRVFGFDPKQFYDGMHMTTINTAEGHRLHPRSRPAACRR